MNGNPAPNSGVPGVMLAKLANQNFRIIPFHLLHLE